MIHKEDVDALNTPNSAIKMRDNANLSADKHDLSCYSCVDIEVEGASYLGATTNLTTTTTCLIYRIYTTLPIASSMTILT